MLKISTYPLGPIQTNCYIVQNEAGQLFNYRSR